MKPAAFDLRHAASVGDAIEILAESDGEGKILAGGQSLGPMLNLRLSRPRLLVDIKRAAGFRELAADGKVFSIGAGWTHAEIEDGVVEDPTQGFLKFVAHGIAYRAVRNRGTMGGSLAHADPAADWVSALAALGATIVAQGAAKQARRYAAETFVEGAFMTKLTENEVIVAIEVPRLSTTARWAYHKINRKTGEFANALGVAILDQKTGLSRVLAGATDGPPLILPRTSGRLYEAGPEAACRLIADELAEILPDAGIDGLELHAVAVRRALMQNGQGARLTMVQVSMSVNGEPVVANVQPRTQLAEFLRDDLCLTGTHLGCEQGVCGACTVMVNGKMQRSCITFAADCDGANITTIEGFDDDPTMNELREAFSECHGLQCGFCTPGMLTTARDIILRLGEIPESRIREELSGNICRCTGYVGIVEAVKKVAAGKVPNAAAAVAIVTAKTFDGQMAAVESVSPRHHVASKPLTDPAAPSSRQIDGGVSIEERIRVRATPERVWEVLSDLRRVVPCVPGAEIATLEGENLTGKVKIALGPIKASFSGQATIGMEDAKREGWMVGKGRDSGLGSSAEGAARWRVVDGDDNDSVVAVVLTWKLSGALAQFNRAGLVQDIVRRLAATFAANLEATITGSTPSVNPGAALGGFGLIWAVFKSRFLQRSNRSESQD